MLRNRNRWLPLLIAGLVQWSAPASANPDATAAVVRLRDTAEVSGRTIRLSEVAEVETADEELRTLLEAVEVGSAPLVGSSRGVSSQYIVVRLRHVGVDLRRIRFEGPGTVSVSRPGQVLTGAALLQSVRATLTAEHPDSTVEISVTPTSLKLPLGVVQIRVQSHPTGSELSGTANVAVFVAGESAATLQVPYRVQRKTPVLVALRDLPVGEVLTEQDVRVEFRPAASSTAALRDLEQVIGLQVAAPLRADAVLTASHVKPALLVKRGTRVKLICKGQAFVVTVTGESLQDGTLGQAVKVRNQSSNQEVIGRVVGAGLVEVAF